MNTIEEMAILRNLRTQLKKIEVVNNEITDGMIVKEFVESDKRIITFEGKFTITQK